MSLSELSSSNNPSASSHTHSQLLASRGLPPFAPLLSSATANNFSADDMSNGISPAAATSAVYSAHPFSSMYIGHSHGQAHGSASSSASVTSGLNGLVPPQESALFSDDTNRLIRLAQSLGCETIPNETFEELRKIREELSARTAAANQTIEQVIQRTRTYVAYVAGAAVNKAMQGPTPYPTQHHSHTHGGNVQVKEEDQHATQHGHFQAQLTGSVKDQPQHQHQHHVVHHAQDDHLAPMLQRGMLNLSASNVALLRNLPSLEAISSHSTPGPLSGLTTPSLYQTPSSSPAATPALSPRTIAGAQASMSVWSHLPSSINTTGESGFLASSPSSALASTSFASSSTQSATQASPLASPIPSSLQPSVSSSSTNASPAPNSAAKDPAAKQKVSFPASSSSRSSSCHRCQTRPKDGVELFRCLNVIQRRRGGSASSSSSSTSSTSSGSATESVCGRLYCSGRCMQPLGFQSRDAMSAYFKAGMPCPHCKDPFSCMNSNCVALKRRRIEAQGEHQESGEHKDAEKKKRKRRKSAKDAESEDDGQKKVKKAKKKSAKKEERVAMEGASGGQTIGNELSLPLPLGIQPFVLPALPSLPYSISHALAQTSYQPSHSHSNSLSSLPHLQGHGHGYGSTVQPNSNMSAVVSESDDRDGADTSCVAVLKNAMNTEDDLSQSKCRRIDGSTVAPNLNVRSAHIDYMHSHFSGATAPQWNATESLMSARHHHQHTHQLNPLALSMAAAAVPVSAAFSLFKPAPMTLNHSSSSLTGALASPPSECESDSMSVHDELVDELENQSNVGYLSQRHHHAYSRSQSPVHAHTHSHSTDVDDQVDADGFSDDSSASPISSYELLLQNDEKDEANN